MPYLAMLRQYTLYGDPWLHRFAVSCISKERSPTISWNFIAIRLKEATGAQGALVVIAISPHVPQRARGLEDMEKGLNPKRLPGLSAGGNVPSTTKPKPIESISVATTLLK